jgi:hypothetical protein
MLPAVLPAVSYRDKRQGRGLKLPEQRSLSLRAGVLGREPGTRLPAAGSREPGACGTVNPGKASINAVIEDKRKLLLRLGQKGTWSRWRAPNSRHAVVAPPAERCDLTHTATATQRGKPVALPFRDSEPQGQPTGLRVEDSGESESRPVMGRIGVAPQTATSPHAKAGRLPSGVGGREPTANRRRLSCRTVGEVARNFAGATAATEVISVAGSAVGTPRLAPSPMRQPRV